jgi:carbamoyltransferase
MIYWGINALNHGSSIAVFNDDQFISNFVSKDDELPWELIDNALAFGKPSRIFWYECPWIKKARQVVAGQWARAVDISVLPSQYLKRCGLGDIPITYTPHHASHAASGYYTSPFNHAAIVVLDAIGEFECATIWEAQDGELILRWSKDYPNSLGLFYSAFTDLIGLTPVRDEYILQQMAEKGDPMQYHDELENYIWGLLNLKKNLHRGVQDWPYEIVTEQDRCDIAASVQRVFEDQIIMIMMLAKKLTNADSLVYMGGCAMNSKANKLFENNWKNIWSLPNPGDPSSSIGAVLYHTKHRVNLEGDVAKHIAIKV